MPHYSATPGRTRDGSPIPPCLVLNIRQTLTTAVAITVSVMRMKAPGMSMNRLPLFCWSMLVQSVMVIFAMPAVMTGSGLLLLDRTVGTHLFNPAEGGDPLLWQHLFWFFGHPEVYIIFVPALGFISHIVATFTRTEIFGYPAMVLSLIATGFIGFGLWVHHMFAAGLPQLGASFFTAASLMVRSATSQPGSRCRCICCGARRRASWNANRSICGHEKSPACNCCTAAVRLHEAAGACGRIRACGR